MEHRALQALESCRERQESTRGREENFLKVVSDCANLSYSRILPEGSSLAE